MFDVLMGAVSGSGVGFLSKVIEKEPGIIVGPISKFLGFILNACYEMVSFITPVNALGLSIILLTIITRTIILPLAFKSQKSMMKMQQLQPEVEKINKKYGDTKDPELLRKKNAEVQALYAKEKANPLSGCLPMLVTMPIFFALSYLMRQSYIFIDSVKDIYYNLTNSLISLMQSQTAAGSNDLANTVLQLTQPIVAPLTKDGGAVSIFDSELMVKVVNKFNIDDWTQILAHIPASDAIREIYNQKLNLEMFLGINLIEFSGWSLPGILIPILTALTSLLSSFIANRTSPATNESAKTTQMTMLIVMPVMMFFFTVNMSAGVGIYWITSSVYQVIQQIILTRFYSKKKDNKEVVKK